MTKYYKIAGGIVLLFLSLCLAGWTTMDSWLGTGFAPVQRVAAGTDTRVAWDADPDCVYFDTTDDYASASSQGLPGGSSNRTFMYWLKDEEPSNTGRAQHFCMGINTGLRDWHIFSESGNFVMGVGWPYFIVATQSRQDVWKNYAAVSTDGTMGGVKMYFDGVPINDYAYTGGASSSVLNTSLNGTFWLGKRTDGGFAGDKRKMAEFAIFNKALTQEEIQGYMPYRFTGTEDGLVRLYHMDEGTGTDCIDSKSGYTMTLNGATWTTK